MSLRKKSLAVLCMATLIAFVLAGCGASQPSTSSVAQASMGSSSASQPTATIEGLKKEGVLTVGVRISASAPFVMGSGSNVSGIDVDLGSSLAKELNLGVAYVSVDDVAKALQETCDIVIDVAPGEANGFDVIGDYAETGHAFFYKGDAKVSTVDEINGKSVGMQQGSSAQMALRVTSLTMNEVTFSSLREAFEALESGTVDYVLCQSCSGAYLTAWNDGLSFAGLLNQPTVQGIAIASGDGAVPKAIREAYESMGGNGVLSEVRRSWLGDCPTLTADSVIQNIPMKETSGEAIQSSSATQEVLRTAMDGSTAGANAVTPEEARALGATQMGGSENQGGGDGSQSSESQSQGSWSSQSQSTQGQANQSQSYAQEYTGYSSGYSRTYESTEANNGGYSGYNGDAVYEESAGITAEASDTYTQNANASGGYTDYGNGGNYTESSGY